MQHTQTASVGSCSKLPMTALIKVGSCGASRQRAVACRCELPARSPGRAGHAAVTALSAAALLLGCASPALPALAEESWERPELPAATKAVSEALQAYGVEQQQKLSAADQAFQKSDTLKDLLEKSEANKAKNKRDIQNKYCYRQAELGIGDCGGLRLIPGMTKNGKQQTPKWMQKALGVEAPPPVEGQGKTLADLLGPVPE